MVVVKLGSSGMRMRSSWEREIHLAKYLRDMKFCSKENLCVHGGNAEDSSLWTSWSRESITLICCTWRDTKNLRNCWCIGFHCLRFLNFLDPTWCITYKPRFVKIWTHISNNNSWLSYSPLYICFLFVQEYGPPMCRAQTPSRALDDGPKTHEAQ